MVVWTATATALFAVWLLLIDTLEAAQLYLGIAAAAIGATASELVRAQRIARVRPAGAWLWRLWRPLAAVPHDIGLLAAEALRAAAGQRPRGRFTTMRFAAKENEPRENARRAAAELAGSFSPNTYVIGIEPEPGTILVHQLVPEEERAEKAIDPLGLR
jgi:multisubunit Na+/H+ antiporter MnhE subunit